MILVRYGMIIKNCELNSHFDEAPIVMPTILLCMVKQIVMFDCTSQQLQYEELLRSNTVIPCIVIGPLKRGYYFKSIHPSLTVYFQCTESQKNFMLNLF